MGANQHTSKGRRSGYRIMFTTEEKRALDARATAEGLTLAELIRRALGLAEAPPVHRSKPGSNGLCGVCGFAPGGRNHTEE
jgi:hypothetical protein